MKNIKQIYPFILVVVLCSVSNHSIAQCDIGDPCMQGDPTCYTNTYSYIENEFVKAGVQGGIPQNLPVAMTISAGDNLQNAINNVSNAGGGVIVLNSGNYDINSTINMKSNVVLRGASQTGTKLRCYMRSTWAQGKKYALYFDDCQYAGIENLTYEFMVSGCTISSAFENDPCGLDDLYVQAIYLDPGSSNCWVQDTRILKSGTDAIYIRGNHNTFRRNFIDQCYNKGVNGNGYYDIRGDNNLFYQEDVNRIRHFSIQRGAKYNVVYQCNFTVDINFHSGDDGYNLIEQNTITIPSYHNWNIFATGGAQYGHEPPGPNNIIVNNTTDYKGWNSPFSDPNTIYTFTTYGDPSATTWSMPPCNTFYPMVACSQVLECSSRINYGTWVNDGNCTIQVCEGTNNVSLRTQPDLSSKTWTGPNGFTATNDWARLNNITPSMAGTYVLTSTDGACTYTTEFELVVSDVNPVCEYNAGSGWVSGDCSPAALCEGEEIRLSVLPNSLSQSWTGPNGFSAIGDATLSNLTTNMSGTYTVTASDGNGCSNTLSIDVIVDDCLPNITDGCYYMQFKHSGKYVSNTGGSGNNGNIQQNSFQNTQAQQFTIMAHSSGDGYTIGAGGSKGIEVASASGANGGNIGVWNLNMSADHHRWYFEDAGGGYYNIRNKNSNLYFSEQTVSNTEGANVHQWQLLGQDNEKVRLIPCSQCPAIGTACNDSDACTGSTTYEYTSSMNANGTHCNCVGTNICTNIEVKTYLGGTFNSTSGMMNNALNLPNSDPYGLGVTAATSVMALTGNNAIVDWVLVELRNSTTPNVVAAQTAALLQRDGDIVDATTASKQLQFIGLPSGTYHIAVRHRNHLGVMSENGVVTVN